MWQAKEDPGVLLVHRILFLTRQACLTFQRSCLLLCGNGLCALTLIHGAQNLQELSESSLVGEGEGRPWPPPHLVHPFLPRHPLEASPVPGSGTGLSASSVHLLGSGRNSTAKHLLALWVEGGDMSSVKPLWMRSQALPPP